MEQVFFSKITIVQMEAGPFSQSVTLLEAYRKLSSIFWWKTPPKKRRGGAVHAPDIAESKRVVSLPLRVLRQKLKSQRIADRREGEKSRERVQENPAVREAQPDLAAELRGMNQTLNAVL
ncbi:uncharacterized protein DS421_4g118740 [Arachis hypogaea]|nr:uncharacterized protein DS421_4g118740 [Arachis hypogaea]